MAADRDASFLMCPSVQFSPKSYFKKVEILFGEYFSSCLFVETNTVGVSAAVNEWSWRLGLWQGRRSVQRGVPAGAALTRTSLSIPVDLRGRSAGLRRDSPHRRLTRPVTRGLMLGWLPGWLAGWVWGCRDDGGGGGGEWVGWG